MNFASFPAHRPRRLRANQGVRDLAQETRLHPGDLIHPIFVCEGSGVRQEIATMPGCHRISLDLLVQEAHECASLGIPAVALFPVVPEHKKNDMAIEAINPEALIPQAVRALKRHVPNLLTVADVALDPFTSHGHDGIADASRGRILNDETLEVLKSMAICLAQAGVDMLAPSEMMDGRVGALRSELDRNGFGDVAIIAYSAKFASGFYGPFRDALGSSLAFGDKSTYQLNPANPREAEKEVELDISEGADMVMIKPGLPYLDVIYRAATISKLPVVTYQVSGEYAMIEFAARAGAIDRRRCVLESLLACKRAGAQAIISYHAKEAARWLAEASS